MIKTIIEKFEQLKLKACAQNLEQVMKLAEEKNRPSLDIIEHLLDFELEARRIRRVALRLKESELIEKPTIDQFDFNFHISRKNLKTRILNLMSMEFVKQKKDIVLIGNPGVGKSFIAKCIAYGATQTGIKTLFTTATDMINHLISAEADHSLLTKLHFYQSPDILVCDEIGYLPLGTQGSNLFFQVISARHERKSTIITTNLTFSEWGKIFDSTTVATAIADRLVYNSEILIMEGKSYRQRTRQNN